MGAQGAPGSREGTGTAKEAPTSRTPDGHPDFSGVYFPGPKDPDDYDLREVNGANKKIIGHVEKPSYQAWVLEKIKLMGDREQANPNLTGCPPPGAVGFFFKGNNAIQLIQTPKELVMLGEEPTSSYRVVYMDGRQHPKAEDAYPLFMGNAVGHWEGDTLVVDTVDVDTHTWVGIGPLFASDVAHYTEIFRRPNAKTFLYQFTIDDPKVLTKPWTSPVARYTLSSHRDIEEFYCTNLQDVAQGLVTSKIPLTPNGADERYFDEQEYQELSKKHNNK